MIDLYAILDSLTQLSPDTKRSYKSNIKIWLAFAGEDPTTWHTVAQAFYDGLLARSTVGSANTLMQGVYSVIASARRAHPEAFTTYPFHPLDVVELRRSEGLLRPRIPLTADRAQALLRACEGPDIIDVRDWAMTVLGFYTGMRVGSLSEVDLDHVDVYPGCVYLNVALKGSAGALRPIPVHPEVWALLEPYRVALVERSVLGGPLFRAINHIRHVNGKLTKHGVTYLLRRRAKLGGLRGFHPHLLRHTFVHWCGDLDGLQDAQIAIVTGHAFDDGPRAADPVHDAVVVDRVRRAIKKRLGV